jgi:hypothetical protein
MRKATGAMRDLILPPPIRGQIPLRSSREFIR